MVPSRLRRLERDAASSHEVVLPGLQEETQARPEHERHCEVLVGHETLLFPTRREETTTGSLIWVMVFLAPL